MTGPQNITALVGATGVGANSNVAARQLGGAKNAPEGEQRELFNQFVGETFFGTLMKSMRSSLGKPAYFHGGRAEEVFQGQLDQAVVEEMSKATAETFAGPMYELFQLTRR